MAITRLPEREVCGSDDAAMYLAKCQDKIPLESTSITILASTEEASFITGTTQVVDGGWMCWP
jgi:hypothetical protein